jgi:hypothetical protein
MSARSDTDEAGVATGLIQSARRFRSRRMVLDVAMSDDTELFLTMQE